MIRCGHCGAPVPARPGRGRPARYCSPAHRVAAHRARRALPELPSVMTERDTWCRADGKRPVTAAGSPASSTDPATWSSYRMAAESTAGDGLGIMLGSGLGCYDLDHVTDDEAGAFIATIAEPIVWIERSASGDGVHVFVEAPEARGWKRTIDGVRVERYTRARFIRVTGAHL